MKKSQRELAGRFAVRKCCGQEEASASSPSECSSKAQTKTILIVDDRVTNRRVLVAMLIHLGYRLLEADSGANALKTVRKEKPDLIIVDILMPQMHGYEFVQKLRRDRKIGRTTVVFFTAGYLEKESRKLAQACGVHHLIVKPVKWEEVDQIVNEALAVPPPGASRRHPLRGLARKYLSMITAKLADKVIELEELNTKLEIEIAERMNVLEELQIAHSETRSAKEDSERANSAKDDFLATLSHELRTPLTPVLMCVTALEQQGSIDPELRAQLSMVRRNVELEARLIDDLLDLTKIAHGKFRLVGKGTIDVHSLLAQTREIVENDATEKFVHLDFDLMASEHHVSGNATRLHQVFWNLVKNAIKFSIAGGRIGVRTFNPKPGKFVLMVEDKGAGITSKTLPVIFRAFQQGETQGARAGGGLGLGLAISKAIIEAHGGTIRAESAGSGRGAIFTVELAAVMAMAAVIPDRQPRLQKPTPHLRLLVIEDHEPTLTIMERLLRQHGHDVFTANNVANALVVASTHPLDLVISDLGLPDGNGIDLMRKLTKDYGLRGIAVSGYGMPTDRAKTQQAGFLAHLVKPINVDQLQSVLGTIGPVAGSNGHSNDHSRLVPH